jgi:hypothetical protein
MSAKEKRQPPLALLEYVTLCGASCGPPHSPT